METIMSTVVEIPMNHIAIVLSISTLALIFGHIKLAVLINYCFIIYSGRLWDLNIFGDPAASNLNAPAIAFTGIWIIIVLLAAVSLAFHRD
jgi:hypothetical protein